MPLTNEDLTVLLKPFPAEAHYFRKVFQEGKEKFFAYLTEESIAARLDEVDPAWEFQVMNLYRHDNQAICIARLIIKGTIRDNTGMQMVEYGKDKAGNPRESGEAEKAATTDAFRRAGRMVGIGRYLLDLPDNVTDVNSMAVHLKKQQGIEERGAREVWWTPVMKSITPKYFEGVTKHAQNALLLMLKEGQIQEVTTVQDVLNAVHAKYGSKQTNERRIS